MSWDNTTLFVDDDPADRAFRQEVREWVAQNLPAELCNRPARIDPPELKPWHRKLHERGWIAPHWPKQYGGMGATLTQQIILFEEISRVGAPTPYPHGLSFIGPLLIDAGTPEQKAKHLPPILTGDVTWCQGYSETGAGSDLASLTTRAELDGDSFIVNGHKTWTTNGHFADWMFALVRTDPKAQPRHAGISMLLIDLKSPGVTVKPIQTIKGDAEFAEELFDERARAARKPARRSQCRLARRQQPARFRALHHRTPAQCRGLPQPGKTSRRAHRRAPRAILPASAGGTGDRSARLLGLLPPRRHAARAWARAALDGSGDQDRRRRARSARVGGAGRRRRALGPLVDDVKIGNHVVNPAADMFEMRRVTVGSGAVEIQRNIIAKRVLGLPS